MLYGMIMKRRWLHRIPTILIVIGALFTIKHIALTIQRKEPSPVHFMVEAPKGFTVFLLANEYQRYNLATVQSLLEQDYEPYKVVILDLVNQPPSLKDPRLHYLFVSSAKEMTKAYLKIVEALNDKEVIVQVAPDEVVHSQKVLHYLSHLYENNNIWLTYADPPFRQKKAQPKWQQAGLKSFYASLVKQLDLDPEKTNLDELLSGIYYLGKHHLYFIPSLP